MMGPRRPTVSSNRKKKGTRTSVSSRVHGTKKTEKKTKVSSSLKSRPSKKSWSGKSKNPKSKTKTHAKKKSLHEFVIQRTMTNELATASVDDTVVGEPEKLSMANANVESPSPLDSPVAKEVSNSAQAVTSASEPKGEVILDQSDIKDAFAIMQAEDESGEPLGYIEVEELKTLLPTLSSRNKMDFSELFRHSGQCKYSPDGNYLATTDGFRLYARDAKTLEIHIIYSCVDRISRIDWSPDSKYILAIQRKRGIVQVWCIEDKTWACKIDQGLAGLSSSRWARDSRHILTTTDFNLRLTIWSLLHNTKCHIKNPKYSERCVAFTTDGDYLAVAHRKDFRDHVGVYYTQTWEMVKYFPLETQDLHDLAWSPDGSVLCAIDTALQYNVQLYSPDGHQVKTFKPYVDALGVKSSMWSPSSKLLAVGSYDQVVRIINNITWEVVAEYEHPTHVSSNVVIYKEENDREASVQQQQQQENDDLLHHTRDVDRSMTVDDAHDEIMRKKLEALQSKSEAFKAATTYLSRSRSETTEGASAPMFSATKYVVHDPPVDLISVRPDPLKPNPQLGVGMIAWSYDDKFLFSRNDNQPNTLWIWDNTTLSLVCTINQLHPVRQARWEPRGHKLAMCTDNGKLYIWSPGACSIVDVPAGNFRVKSLHWNADGRSIVLIGVNKFCCCFIVD